MTCSYPKKLSALHPADVEVKDFFEHVSDKGIVVDPGSQLALLATDLPGLQIQVTVPSRETDERRFLSRESAEFHHYRLAS